MRLVMQAVLAAAAFSILSWANDAIAASPRLFANDDVLSMSLSGPIPSLSRSPGAKPVPGVLKVLGSAPETLPVLLSTRGITRRMKDICAFPPLRVEFTNKPGKDSIFRGQKRLKLVTHCQSSDRYQQYVLLEYSAYRMYRTLTPESFNVRLAKVDYQHEDGSPLVSRTGFFIEDIDDVAYRNGRERLRGANRIAVAQLDPAAAARFAVFQDLISNLDWAMTAAPLGDDCCHNSRILALKGATTALIPVPYDFDYSGLVNAPYAVPPDGIHVQNVRVRRYRGFCVHSDQAQAFATELATRRTDLIAIVDSTPGLDERSRQEANNYLGEFFDQIATPAQRADLMQSCLH